MSAPTKRCAKCNGPVRATYDFVEQCQECLHVLLPVDELAAARERIAELERAMGREPMAWRLRELALVRERDGARLERDQAVKQYGDLRAELERVKAEREALVVSWDAAWHDEQRRADRAEAQAVACDASRQLANDARCRAEAQAAVMRAALTPFLLERSACVHSPPFADCIYCIARTTLAGTP